MIYGGQAGDAGGDAVIDGGGGQTNQPPPEQEAARRKATPAPVPGLTVSFLYYVAEAISQCWYNGIRIRGYVVHG